jgi:hypothetical protein
MARQIIEMPAAQGKQITVVRKGEKKRDFPDTRQSGEQGIVPRSVE